MLKIHLKRSHFTVIIYGGKIQIFGKVNITFWQEIEIDIFFKRLCSRSFRFWLDYIRRIFDEPLDFRRVASSKWLLPAFSEFRQLAFPVDIWGRPSIFLLLLVSLFLEDRKKLEIIDKMKDCNATKFTSFCFPTFCIHYWWDVRHLAMHRILQPSSNLSNLKARGCQNWQGRIIKGQIRSWQVRKGKVVFQQKGSLTKRPTRRCHAAKKRATKDVAKSAKRMGLDLR